MKRGGSTRGMSLVELTIVIVVLGVIMAGVFMLFISGTEHFNFARRQNELDITGRLIIDRVTNEVIWAGFMPQGGWDNDEWHPVVKSTPDSLVFFADLDATRFLDPTDYRFITTVNQRVRISDGGSRTQDIGENVTGFDLEYLDEGGNLLPFPLDAGSRDMVRHIALRLELTAVYTDDVYQTVLHTSISPRNLGVNHNIDPSFFPPQPMRGVIVLNIDGDSLNPNPTLDEQEMSDRLQLWGYTVRELTDDELLGYDYVDVDALILRHMPLGNTHFDPGFPNFFEDLPVPTITLSAFDAIALYGMGTGALEVIEDSMTIVEYGPPTSHLPGAFPVYEPLSNAYQSVLSGMTPLAGDTLYIIAGDGVDSSGVYAINLEADSLRRVHLSAWQARYYHGVHGWELFYNVVKWLAVEDEGYLGTPITVMEDFEGPQATSQEINLWSDGITPVPGIDTVQVFFDPFTGGYASNWTMSPLGGGRIGIYNNALRMDRSAVGAATRNLAALNLDLSAYDENTDNLRLTYSSFSAEGFPDSMDGVFFNDYPVTQLTSIDFESGTPGNVSFYTTTGGRNRRLNTAGWGGSGYFITLDAAASGTYGTNRMRVSVPTAGVSPGDLIRVDYRFHDHNDESTSSMTGDFLAWNTTGSYTTSTLISYLDPANASWNDNTWYSRSGTLTVPGVVPNPIYIVFGQYDNQQAATISTNDGISFDNIVVSALGDTTYTQLGSCSGAASWSVTTLDLDQAARDNSYPFGADYRVLLSQYGTGTLPGSGGRLWDDVEVTALVPGTVINGWRHGRMAMNREDDWRYKSILPAFEYSWVTQTVSGSSYSNNSYCYLLSPSVSIPDWISEPSLEFSHRMLAEAGTNDDGGFVQISVDEGPWSTLTLASGLQYTGTSSTNFPGGSGIPLFAGTTISTPRIESIDLEAYIGHSVRFRFVFGSDGSTTGSGWLLDNFNLSGEAFGYQVSGIEFEAETVPAGWNYLCDIYMSSGTDSTFSAAGEWDAGTMVQVASDMPVTVGTGGWNTLTLETPYILPPGSNLYVKIEQGDTGWTGSVITWLCKATGGFRCRQAQSDTVDPILLLLHSNRPNVRLLTSDGILPVEGGTVGDQSVPLNNSINFNDCEMIFSASEMGTEGGTGIWTHGGTLDDWEIGEPLVLSIDPPLTSENGMSVAGTDLTVNGFYNANEWAWFASPAYEMPDPAMYDSVSVKIFKCLRNAPNDDNFIEMAFSDTDTPPDSSSSDWILVRPYYGVNESIWDYEVIDLTNEFDTAWSLGRSYFFIRFIQSSGPFGERGGWNIDNIQFYAR